MGLDQTGLGAGMEMGGSVRAMNAEPRKTLMNALEYLENMATQVEDAYIALGKKLEPVLTVAVEEVGADTLVIDKNYSETHRRIVEIATRLSTLSQRTHVLNRQIDL